MKKQQTDAKTLATRALKRAGASEEQITAFEVAVLNDVMAHSSISGNASDYVLERIRILKRDQ